MLSATCAAIKAALPSIPGGERTLVGFITHDSAVHFYAFRKGGKPPSVFVVADLGVAVAGVEGGGAGGQAEELFLPALPEVRFFPSFACFVCFVAF